MEFCVAASDDSSYVTGIELFVDGGLLRYNWRYARNEHAMRTVGDLLGKNLEAFGERDVEKRRTAISMICETYSA